MAASRNILLYERLSKTSIVPNAKELAQETGLSLPRNDKVKETGALSPSEALVPITDAVIKGAIDPTAAIAPIAEALAQQMGLSLPGNDKVKEAGALLAFQAIKAATGVLFPALAESMTFNPIAFTLVIIQKKLDDISNKLDTLLEKDKKLGPLHP